MRAEAGLHVEGVCALITQSPPTYFTVFGGVKNKVGASLLTFSHAADCPVMLNEI